MNTSPRMLFRAAALFVVISFGVIGWWLITHLNATEPFMPHVLGLAIVKEFVELHRGAIRVGDSSLGGAAFRIELPLKAPPASR